MRRTFTALALGMIAILGGGSSEAARPIETSVAPAAGSYELIVLEVPGCIYCRVFRRDVVPAYEASARAREVPMRFVDLNDIDEDRMGLSSPIDVVPTVVLMHEGREVGRIAGYLGPESFFHSVTYMMSQQD